MFFKMLFSFFFLVTACLADNDNFTNKKVQIALNHFGFFAGSADGIFGQKTYGAISRFQACLGQKADAEFTNAAQDFLLESYHFAMAQNLQGSCNLLKRYISNAYDCSYGGWKNLFSCDLASDEKTISVCAISDQSRYTFGSFDGVPDIRIFANLQKAYIPWMGTGRHVNETLSFKDKDLTYRVHFSLDRSAKSPKVSGGIDVIQQNQIIAAMSCHPASIKPNINYASNLLEEIGICWEDDEEVWKDCEMGVDWERFSEGPIYPYEAYQLGRYKSPCEEKQLFPETNGPTQNEVYEFGLYLQELVRRKDLSSLYDNVKKQLIKGPKIDDIAKKSFEDYFSENWRQTILSIEPECTPVGFKGYMMSRGLIWFDKIWDSEKNAYSREWTIISINNDLEP